MCVSGLRAILIAATAAAFVTPFLCVPASAQETAQERAWRECLAAIDQARPRATDGSNQTERVAAFKACMAERGVRP
jgi:hypothetical protein